MQESGKTEMEAVNLDESTQNLQQKNSSRESGHNDKHNSETELDAANLVDTTQQQPQEKDSVIESVVNPPVTAEELHSVESLLNLVPPPSIEKTQVVATTIRVHKGKNPPPMGKLGSSPAKKRPPTNKKVAKTGL